MLHDLGATNFHCVPLTSLPRTGLCGKEAAATPIAPETPHQPSPWQQAPQRLSSRTLTLQLPTEPQVGPGHPSQQQQQRKHGGSAAVGHPTPAAPPACMPPPRPASQPAPTPTPASAAALTGCHTSHTSPRYVLPLTSRSSIMPAQQEVKGLAQVTPDHKIGSCTVSRAALLSFLIVSAVRAKSAERSIMPAGGPSTPAQPAHAPPALLALHRLAAWLAQREHHLRLDGGDNDNASAGAAASAGPGKGGMKEGSINNHDAPGHTNNVTKVAPPAHQRGVHDAGSDAHTSLMVPQVPPVQPTRSLPAAVHALPTRAPSSGLPIQLGSGAWWTNGAAASWEPFDWRPQGASVTEMRMSAPGPALAVQRATVRRASPLVAAVPVTTVQTAGVPTHEVYRLGAGPFYCLARVQQAGVGASPGTLLPGRTALGVGVHSAVGGGPIKIMPRGPSQCVKLGRGTTLVSAGAIVCAVPAACAGPGVREDGAGAASGAGASALQWRRGSCCAEHAVHAAAGAGAPATAAGVWVGCACPAGPMGAGAGGLAAAATAAATAGDTAPGAVTHPEGPQAVGGDNGSAVNHAGTLRHGSADDTLMALGAAAGQLDSACACTDPTHHSWGPLLACTCARDAAGTADQHLPWDCVGHTFGSPSRACTGTHDGSAVGAGAAWDCVPMDQGVQAACDGTAGSADMAMHGMQAQATPQQHVLLSHLPWAASHFDRSPGLCRMPDAAPDNDGADPMMLYPDPMMLCSPWCSSTSDCPSTPLSLTSGWAQPAAACDTQHQAQLPAADTLQWDLARAVFGAAVPGGTLQC